MKFFFLSLIICETLLAADLPKDIKLEKGSLLVLKQHLEKQENADLSFPVVVQLTCKPRLKNNKLQTHECQLSDLKYAQK